MASLNQEGTAEEFRTSQERNVNKQWKFVRCI